MALDDCLFVFHVEVSWYNELLDMLLSNFTIESIKKPFGIGPDQVTNTIDSRSPWWKSDKNNFGFGQELCAK